MKRCANWIGAGLLLELLPLLACASWTAARHSGAELGPVRPAVRGGTRRRRLKGRGRTGMGLRLRRNA